MIMHTDTDLEANEIRKHLYVVQEGEVRPITLREFLRLKAGDKVLCGRPKVRFRFPNELVRETTFGGHSEKHPRSWFRFERQNAWTGDSVWEELHWSRLYVWDIPERDEIHEMIGYDS
jgi:hypothetical protein